MIFKNIASFFLRWTLPQKTLKISRNIQGFTWYKQSLVLLFLLVLGQIEYTKKKTDQNRRLQAVFGGFWPKENIMFWCVPQS